MPRRMQYVLLGHPKTAAAPPGPLCQLAASWHCYPRDTCIPVAHPRGIRVFPDGMLPDIAGSMGAATAAAAAQQAVGPEEEAPLAFVAAAGSGAVVAAASLGRDTHALLAALERALLADTDAAPLSGVPARAGLLRILWEQGAPQTACALSHSSRLRVDVPDSAAESGKEHVS